MRHTYDVLILAFVQFTFRFFSFFALLFSLLFTSILSTSFILFYYLLLFSHKHQYNKVRIKLIKAAFSMTTFTILGFLILLLGIVPAYVFLKSKGKPELATILKGIGTLIPLLIGFLRFIRTPSWIGFLIILSIGFGFVGDMFLETNFRMAIRALMLEVVLIILCYLFLDAFHIISFILLIILLILLLNEYQYYLPLLGRHKKTLAFYGFLILMMTSMAFVLPFIYNFKGILIALGGICYALSNYLLARKYICPTAILYSYLILGLYYFSKIFLALSTTLH